jgi:hypothetical protein
LQGNAQDAGLALLMQCLATSTLGGRDERTINLGKHLSKIFGAVPSEAWDILSIAEPLNWAKCCDEHHYRRANAISRILATHDASLSRKDFSTPRQQQLV